MQRVADSRPIFREGARDIAPLVVAVVPYALAIGAVVGASSVPAAAGWASGPLILAGTAQLTTLQMLDTGTAPLVIVLSALLINTRLIAYGAGLAPWFGTLSRRRRLLLAAPLLDQLYLAVAPRFERGDLDERGRQAYYAGAAIATVLGWSAAQLVGVFAGAAVPDAVGLEVAAPITFAGLLARATASRASLTVAVAALAVGAAAGGLPYRSGPLAAAAVGVGVGCIAFPARRGGDR